MSTKKPAPTGFDAEVDSARNRLEAALNEETGFDDLAALQALAAGARRLLTLTHRK